MASVYLRRPRLAASGLLTCGLIASCSSSDISAPAAKGAADFSGNAKLVRGEAEVIPANSGPGEGEGGDQKLIGGNVTFVDAEYEVSIKISAPEFGVQNVALPCQSRVKVKVNINLDAGNKDKILDFPDGNFDCGVLGKLDVKTLLGVVAKALPTDTTAIQVVDNVISVKEIAKGKFDPPRPIFPSFIAASNKDLSGINVNVPTAKLTTAKGTYTGSYGMKVDFAGSTENAPGTVGKQLKRVMQFTTVSSGFSGTDKLAVLLVDSLRVKLNVAPIVLPSLEIRAVAGELFTTEAIRSGEAAATGFIGTGLEVLKKLSPDGIIMNALKKFPVDMKLTLIQQVGLDEAIAQAEADVAKSRGGRVTVD
ncbi:MAG: hypothetical protein FJ146_01505 [Deltaproteobacteria bacterium]|nr:hypothetical protein [Deltaproteobacteria bacterium]